ncbi:MAG: DUF2799 domain-containing protein [Methylococcales bacterium]|nr:DUF2799 domain-containing protein [Methylococcales bacterium]
MKPLKPILLIVTLLSTSGCATLSREDCMQGAWFDLGLSDGRRGKTFTRLGQHQKACLDYGIHIDNEQYNQGRDVGLKDYCQLDNAIDMGLRGHRYQSVCPPETHAVFLRYNQAAYDVYRCQEDLEGLDDDLYDKENSLLNNKLTDDDRSQIRVDIRDLDRERQRIRDDLYSRERRLESLINRGY